MIIVNEKIANALRLRVVFCWRLVPDIGRGCYGYESEKISSKTARGDYNLLWAITFSKFCV